MPDMARKAGMFHDRDHEPSRQEARYADHENPGKEQAHKPELRPIYGFKNDQKAEHESETSRIPEPPQRCSRRMRLSQGGRFLSPLPQAIQIEVNDRRRVEYQYLRYGQTADDCDSERLSDFRTVTVADRKRNRTKHRGQGGHHDGTKPNNTCLVN